MRILVIYEHPAIRKLLELFARACEEIPGTEPHQELILLDAARMEQIPEYRRSHPGSPIAVITDLPEYSWPRRARELGADSFWYIEPEEERFRELVRQTLAGKSVYPDSVPVRQLGDTLSSSLTERELDVLKTLAGGKTDDQIAQELFVSVRTVKTHIQNMREKTGFRNRTELAVRARGLGLVISDDE